MKTWADPESRGRLHQRVRSLARALRGICQDPALEAGGRGGTPELTPLSGALLLLEGKLAPELSTACGLPLFVGIQGGTNVGKSTVFNAVCGKILSPSLVTASATKHPLLFAHERHRATLLAPGSLGDVCCEELADPKQLITAPEKVDIAYATFHDDPALEGVVVLDSPDFDSSLLSNAVVAARVAALSDVTVFVTSSQKYADRALVEELARLLQLKGRVVLVLNQVDEEIVFRTLVDDLRETLAARMGGKKPPLEAIQIPRVDSRHPEDKIRLRLESALLPRLEDRGLERLKLEVLVKSLDSACSLALRVVEDKSRERALKADLKRFAQDCAQEAATGYARGFQLALPEETLAVQLALKEMELLRLFDLGTQIERSSAALSLFGGSVRRCRDACRRLLLKLCRSSEGVLGGSAAEYASARDRSDGEHIARIAEGLRVRVESRLRKEESWSPLVQRILSEHFTPQMPTELAQRAQAAHADLISGRRLAAGETILERTRHWLHAKPARARLLRLGAILLKVGLGVAVAWALPPDSGLLAILHPLEWLYFALGYTAGAYGIALVATRILRRRDRFRRSRIESMRDAIGQAFVTPLGQFLDGAFSDERLLEVEKLVKELRAATAGSAPADPGPAQGTGS